MCDGADNERMVQCDGWCHYDCAKVGDEIEDLNWKCESCMADITVASDQHLMQDALTPH